MPAITSKTRLLAIFISVVSVMLFGGSLTPALAQTTTFSADTTLSADVYCTNLTIAPGVTLTTNGHNIYCTGTVTNNGLIQTGSVENGGTGANESPAGATNGGAFPNSYGGSGGGGGGSSAVTLGAAQISGSGGNTAASGGSGGSEFGGSCGTGGVGSNGSAASLPSLTNALIQNWINEGLSNFLAGAGGGGGAGSGYLCSDTAGSPGGSGAFGIYIQANKIVAGNMNASGQDGATGGSAGGGGGGGGTILLSYGKGGYTAGSYNINGGSGGSPGPNGGSGGNGLIRTFSYGTTPPTPPPPSPPPPPPTQDPGASSSLLLNGGAINGQSVSPSNRTVTVAPGASITGSFVVTINSTWYADDVMAMGVTPTWGTPSTSFVDLGGFSSPVSGLQRTINVNLTAPTTPGTYYIIAAYRAEFTAAQVMSCTNWSVGSLNWNTGYAVADWSTATINTADTAGTVLVDYLFPGGNTPVYMPATAIQIVVTPPPTFVLSASAPTSQTVALTGSVCFPITIVGQNLTSQALPVTLSASSANPSFLTAFSSSPGCYPATASPGSTYSLNLSTSMPTATLGLIVTAQLEAPTAPPDTVTVSGCAGSCEGNSVSLSPGLTVTAAALVGVQHTLTLNTIDASSSDNCPTIAASPLLSSHQCFSVQQNFWIYTGNNPYPSFWAQNIVLLWQPPLPVNPSGAWFAHPMFQVFLVNSATGKLTSAIPGSNATIPIDCDAYQLLGFCAPLGIYNYSFPLLWTNTGKLPSAGLSIAFNSTLSENQIHFTTSINQKTLADLLSHPSLTALPNGPYTMVGAGQVPVTASDPATPANSLYEPQLVMASVPEACIPGLPCPARQVKFQVTSGQVTSTVTFSGQSAPVGAFQSPIPTDAVCASTEETSTGLFWNQSALSFGPSSSSLNFPGEGVTSVPGTGRTCSDQY